MKMKIEIDLQDLINNLVEDAHEYDEGEAYYNGIELSDAIKGSIKNSVINELLPKMKASIEEGITKKVDTIITERVNSTVDKTLQGILENDDFKFNSSRFSGTIKDYIKEKFEDSRNWGNPREALDQIAKKYAQEMKLQYNNIFAARVVDNMREQGLLIDDFAKLLTEKPST